ncbi:MAG TPA: nucleotidyltransferase domain-containing protein [Candidatus Paceibacterota bacterium]|jgi:predicted nucleotidyltransferase
MINSSVPVQKIGSYFEIDNDGYVTNPSSLEKLQAEWKPLIDEVVEAYKRHSGDTLHSIYVRGSVARGKAITGISDVDSYAYTTQEGKLDKTWMKEEEETLLKRFPFAEGIEFSLDLLKFAEEDHVMLAQSVCLYGTDLTIQAPKLKPGRDMVVHVLTLGKRLEWLEKRLQQIDSEEDIKKACLWLMKTFLRSGFELTMPLSGMYTRDLYPCYETFSKYYPDRESQMCEFLRLALNPIADKKTLRVMAREFGGWLQEEAKRVYT